MDSGTGHAPDPAAIDRVRRDLAHLGADADSAPDVPAAVTARIGAALRAASPPAAHAVSHPLPRPKLLPLIVGIAAAVAGIVGGALMLARDPAPTLSTGPTAESITVSRPPPAIPLSDAQIVGLLSVKPDYGLLTDPQRRGSCLEGLGYPEATKVLGARPLDMFGRPAVLMLLPGETPTTVLALVVEPNCSRAHTGLLADTVVTRP
ncbi:hypothetical protein [Mycobacterium sp.]|uniref:hypothetical protein n=1 Tax=Mycobacterium sp. TaxID=1785 RepID=UPI002DB41B7A|nr:hypothetical protein [Mycobacterium sp.]